MRKKMTEQDFQKSYDKRDDDLTYTALMQNRPTPMTAADIENYLRTRMGVSLLGQIETSLAWLVADEDAKTDDGLTYRVPGKRRSLYAPV